MVHLSLKRFLAFSLEATIYRLRYIMAVPKEENYYFFNFLFFLLLFLSPSAIFYCIAMMPPPLATAAKVALAPTSTLSPSSSNPMTPS